MAEREFVPFYKTCKDPAFLEEERMQGREDALMRSFYPDRAGKLRDLVEEECGLLDYEGSRIYDEFPDRSMVRRMSGEILRRIGKEFPEEYRNADFLQEMTDVFFCQEIYRRRCRRRKFRGY